jgi:hypothetical protein
MSRQLRCRMLHIGQMLKVVMQAYNSVQKEVQEAEVQTPEHKKRKAKKERKKIKKTAGSVSGFWPRKVLKISRHFEKRYICHCQGFQI